MPYFNPITIGGQTYHFQHLDPFTFSFHSDFANKPLTIGVVFSNHCFTKKYIQATHPVGDPILYDGGRRPRSFCSVRYGTSQLLPNLVAALNHPRVKVFQTVERRNWVHSVEIATPQGPFHIFFEVSRVAGAGATHDLKLTIESAYPEDAAYGPPGKLGRMGFHLLCSKVFLRLPLATKR